jgi:repressor of nif and glnA expression
MATRLPAGANISLIDQKRISDALEALEKDVHAPRSITVEVGLHVHHEYPKHVTIGKRVIGTDVEGAEITEPITTVVNDADEEAALTPAE